MKLNNTSDKVELVQSDDPWHKNDCKKTCEDNKKSPIKRKRLSDNCKCTSENKSPVFYIVYNLLFIMLSILISIVFLKKQKYFKFRK